MSLIYDDQQAKSYHLAISNVVAIVSQKLPIKISVVVEEWVATEPSCSTLQMNFNSFPTIELINGEASMQEFKKFL